MDFLGLVRALAREADVSGSAPATVVGQTGEIGRLVDWIQQSYLDIQLLHPTWRFLRKNFAFNTAAGDRSYTFAEIKALAPLTFSIRQLDGETLRCYKVSEGIATEGFMYEREWPNFRNVYLMGQANLATGRPCNFSVDPSDTLQLDVLPDDIYTVYGECLIVPERMAEANTSVPILPEFSHMIIVWHALMNYAGFEEDSPQFVRGQNWYNSLLHRLEDSQLPELVGAPPLV